MLRADEWHMWGVIHQTIFLELYNYYVKDAIHIVEIAYCYLCLPFCKNSRCQNKYL